MAQEEVLFAPIPAVDSFECGHHPPKTSTLKGHNKAGCLRDDQHIFGEAIEHLSKAIRLDNDKKATLYAHYYLGQVYFEREMFEDAQTFFEKTLALGPNLIEAYYELGRAQWYAEDPDAARETWARGFKANKLSPWGKRCEDVLEIVARGEEPPQ